MPEEFVPPVVAVVVTAEADAWLEPCLESLGQQDYASLDVLVIDTSAADGVTNRVAQVTPGAFVRRRPHAGGFGAAANDVLAGIEGASFFLFCHDDVVLAPNAVSLLVEEAFRSNAGVVGPKIVDIEHPDRLLEIGLGVSRFGTPVPRLIEGELDQAQHDEVREVFAVPSACLLSRVDLFEAVGGFDSEMGPAGEAVDLCWRVQLAGARVVTAPRVEVRRPRTRAGRQTPDVAQERRDELRTVLKNYALVRRWLSVTQLLALTLLDTLTAPLTDRRGRARAERGAFAWNLAHRRSMVQARRTVRDVRQVSDRLVVSRMTSRSRPHRLAAQLLPGERPRRLGGERRLAPWSPGDGRSPRQERHLEVDKVSEWLARAQRGELPIGQMVAAVVLGLLVLVGIRDLLFGSLPVVGGLVSGPAALHLLGQWWTGRTDPGWRHTQAGPPADALLGAAGLVLGNSSALALKLAYVSGPIVGTIGVARLVRDFGSSRARVVAAIVFAGSPMLWNVLATGDLEASVALAGLPFVLGRLARASRLRPFVPAHGGSARGWRPRDLLAEIAPLGLLLAAMSALAPAVVLDVGLIVLGMLAASLVVGGAAALARSAVVGLGGLAVAFVCCLPWSVTWLQHGARWSLFAGAVPPAGQTSGAADLLRGHLGPVGDWWGAFGLVLAAAFALLWARGPRLAWATRWWVCAVGSVVFAWAGSEGLLGAGGGSARLLVAPATVCLAACCGIGTAAFEHDLRRHRFGWRQFTGILAVGSLGVGLVPAFGVVFGGRADLPGLGFEAISSEFSTAVPPGARVLWIGSPRAVPGASFQAASGTSAFVTTTGLPTMSTLWPSPAPGPAVGAAGDVATAVAGRTLQLGSLLAPVGIRYVVVPTAGAPALIGVQATSPAMPPPELVQALQNQTDLRQLPNEDGVLVFENVAWLPADGTGTLAPARPARSTLPRTLGVVGALVLAAACIFEGLWRRRAPRRRATRPSQPRRRRRQKPTTPAGDDVTTEAMALQGAATGEEGTHS